MQLYVPEIYSKELLALCHEQVSGHLGTTKVSQSIFLDVTFGRTVMTVLRIILKLAIRIKR